GRAPSRRRSARRRTRPCRPDAPSSRGLAAPCARASYLSEPAITRALLRAAIRARTPGQVSARRLGRGERELGSRLIVRVRARPNRLHSDQVLTFRLELRAEMNAEIVAYLPHIADEQLLVACIPGGCGFIAVPEVKIQALAVCRLHIELRQDVVV